MLLICSEFSGGSPPWSRGWGTSSGRCWMVGGRQKNNRHKLKLKRFTLGNRKLLHSEESWALEVAVPRSLTGSMLEVSWSKLDKTPSGLMSHLPLLWAGGWLETCSSSQTDLLYDPTFPTMLKAREFWGKAESNHVPCHSSRWPLPVSYVRSWALSTMKAEQFTM